MSYKITYHITLEDGTQLNYSMNLDATSGHLIPDEDKKESRPEWTQLDHEKCGNCSLNSGEHSHCPVALNLSHVVEDFKEMLSFTKVKVRVETPDRDYLKDTDLQTALQSIFGIVMATSGCPILDYFRPMARFHLPFASLEEHMLRSTSFHLLKELFKSQNGAESTFDLSGLKKQYERVSAMNADFSKRIYSVAKKDADKNAIVGLHTIGEMIGTSIDSKLEFIEPFFKD